MHKFLAIIKKDWRLFRKTIFMQAWIALGIWVVSLIGGFILWAVIKHQVPEADLETSGIYEVWDTLGGLLVYASNFYQVILPGLLGLVFSVAILIGALNSDLRNNCEIFYRTQPVSLWWRAGSKYIVGLFFTLGVMLGITLLQFVISNVLLLFFVDSVDWGVAFVGTMQYWFYFTFGTILSGSIAWFFSAVFKEHAFFKTAGIVVGVALLLVMINGALTAAPILFNGWSTDFRVPELTKLIFDYPIADMRMHDVWLQYAEFNDPSDFTPDMLKDVIHTVWKLIWSWDTLVKVVVSGGLFTAGTWIYIRKEVL